MDEHDAIRLMRQGNIDGLEVLVRLHERKALQIAQLITREVTLAQDVVQDAFIRAYEYIYQYDSERLFTRWFFQIVANLAVRAVSRQRKEVSLEADEVQAFLVDSRFDPDALIEHIETEDQIVTLLNALPADQRAVFVLRYYLDYSEAETADRLNSPLGTVKWRLHRARERMKAWLSPYYLPRRKL